MTGSAVDMHVEERGSECCAGEVEDARIGGHGRRFAGGDGIDAAVFDDDERMVDEAGSIPEPLRCDYRLHRDDYCRRVMRGVC